MRLLLACGGTAGHINPALAIADEFRRLLPDSKILFVGSGRPLENRLVPKAGYEIENIALRGLERGISPGKILRNLRNVRTLSLAMKKSAEIIRRFKPDAIVGTGGYICYPVLRKGSEMGIPTFIHESNAVPGLTTRFLSRRVDRVLVAFPEAAAHYGCREKVVFTGTPVRAEFSRQDKSVARLRLGVDGRPLVVSFWGSLGAEKMNAVIADFIEYNIESRMFNHIHATGGSAATTEALVKNLRGRAGNLNIPEWIDIRTYIDDMPTVMAAADIVLCRAGASTIAELTFLGRPAVLVPSPNVTNNHQEKNALYLARAGGAVIIEERECTGEKLYETVSKLLKDKPRLAEMARAMKSAGVPDSARRIVELIISMC